MKVQILGTAAAEGWPGVFCDCPACMRARELGGRDHRTRGSVHVDDLLKIDLPQDTYHHVLTYGLRLDLLKYILITHHHPDHCCPIELEFRKPPFSHSEAAGAIGVYANSASLEVLRSRPSLAKGTFHRIEPFQTLDLAPFEVTTVRAVHAEADSMNFIVTRGGKGLLYACDTGPYAADTWQFLAKLGRRVDLVIADCTRGTEADAAGKHMGLPQLVDFRANSQAAGLTDTDTRWVLTHFSHNIDLTHDQLTAAVAVHGFEAAWDGRVLEV